GAGRLRAYRAPPKRFVTALARVDAARTSSVGCWSRYTRAGLPLRVVSSAVGSFGSGRSGPMVGTDMGVTCRSDAPVKEPRVRGPPDHLRDRLVTQRSHP